MGDKRHKLKNWLVVEGRSQKWLAKNSKVSINSISDICTGKRHPSVPTIKKIMSAIKKVDKSAKAEDFFDI
ncbi:MULTISPECIES: helix-turn-helix transcriptional regulator [Priestia]|jgi:predicted transcriptional regulator|uniref:helix-turn-helix transcriptional regulator n=1 Tax=Priestia TaxID=2800373 RepID=UPI00124C9746|nr:MULTISPECIES: helix-turn-helix transcriptional regulator [Priestia]KAB2488205.1 helix-turn-helix transcriptional regulator [Priestia endophytica]MED3729513.1 helix-turn-helix transcriptional regulator [Priestia filamentosa]